MKILLTVLLFTFFAVSGLGQTSDAALRRAIEADKASRDATGKLPTLTAAEHMSRAEAYSANRLFPEAREHWQKVFDNYPNDPGIPKALFGTARSYMWERKYAEAVTWFDKLTKDHLDTKDGREGLAFKGASYVRMGKNLEAARTYEQYVSMFPQGERIESAHLNIIDAYREAGKYDDANRWVESTVQKYPGKPSEVNSLHARLRMEIFRENWAGAIAAADQLLSGKSFAGAMAGSDEVKYLKGLSLERLGRKNESAAAYSSISQSDTSYFGGLALDKRISSGVQSTLSVTGRKAADYPVLFRTELLREARKNKIDPRFLLAIMKQESSFRANAKSPAGARGLLQLVFDTAVKYNKKAGYPNLRPDDLYEPAVSIAVGSAYIGELKNEFGGLYEAIAASYNGGEDNAARWLNRTKPKDPGIFAAEIGFAETKSYVFKVMNNYRAYRDLYREDLSVK
ncbi:MAG: transglycosylase SLT domain-containing protein [Acidobacteria bacterium]|nr:transglycosylase SLT domain-containing protein [Acidobacteriota bacterium]